MKEGEWEDMGLLRLKCAFWRSLQEGGFLLFALPQEQET